MFTIRTSDTSVKKSREYADARINKPFSMGELLDQVKMLLEAHKGLGGGKP
ncbi:MAG: hypothetical protein ACE5J5_07270 [Candidatus Hydrothermarchaeales archaeon]